MIPSDTPDSRPSRQELAAQLTQELIQMRDALLTLSLCLKDWQFELDQGGQRISQKLAARALEPFRLKPAGATDQEKANNSQASKDL